MDYGCRNIDLLASAALHYAMTHLNYWKVDDSNLSFLKHRHN